jgi:hypothetical protein
MCRAITKGGRRCPYHSDNRVMSVASARTSIRRWEAKLYAAEATGADDATLNHALSKLGAAEVRLRDREQTRVGTPVAHREPDHPAAQPLPAPRPTRAHSITRERVDAMSWDELADEHARLGDDPEAQARLEEWVEDRERRESVASYDYPTRNLSDEDLAWIRGENQDGRTSSIPDGRTSDARVSQNDWARQQYDDYVAVQYDRAMIATNGQMVNERGRLAGVDSYSLFSGPVARVKRYGSEELQGFFGQNGRHTFKSFRYSLFKWRSDYTAHENAKNEDFGHVPHVTQHIW